MKFNRLEILNALLSLVFFVAFPLSSQATVSSLTVVSDPPRTKFFYYGSDGSNYPVTRGSGLPSGWNSDPSFNDTGWAFALPYQHPAWFPPGSTPPFDATSAVWIAPSAANGAGPDAATQGPRGIYLYRRSFQMPATAYNVTGQAALGSDNYGWLDINGIQVLEPRSGSQSGQNYYAPPSEGSIPSSVTGSFACNNILAAEIQNGVSISVNGPTGVVFLLKLDYEVPYVMWQPPITHSEPFYLKDGTSLPLKFKLFTEGGTLLTDPQDVFLAVHKEMSVGGDLIEDWHLGAGIDHLRFDSASSTYIATFKTMNYRLMDGETYTYTAFVQDGCTDLVLGSVTFSIRSSSGTNRGGN